MPGIFLLQPSELLFCLGKLEVVHVIQCLGGFQLHGDAGNQDDGGVFPGGLAAVLTDRTSLG